MKELTRWAALTRLIRTLRAGGPNGDIALLKNMLFRVEAPPAIDAQLDDVRGYLPPPDLDAMRALPDGTLGREVVRQLDDNGFEPFVVSEDLRPLLDAHTYIARYVATHDVFHVLTGFDTSLPGEIGVLAFTHAQGFAPKGEAQLRMARLMYPLRRPDLREAIAHNEALGRALGERAPMLLGERWEACYTDSIEALRQEFGLPSPARDVRYPDDSRVSPFVRAVS